MSERVARQLLSGIRSTARQLQLYPSGHPATQEALEVTSATAEALAKAAGGEAILSMLGDSFYLGRDILAHASLEFNGLLREFQSKGIESITFLSPVSEGDAADLAAFLGGMSGDLPAEGTVRFNEGTFSLSDLDEGPYAGLRRSYARSLDVLRGIAMANSVDQDFDLSGATWAVEQLIEQTLSQPSAALLLANLKSHDEYTFYHSVNVCLLSSALSRVIGLDMEQLGLLGVGALLHDIGKVAVTPGTLQHPGRLDNNQWSEIKRHPLEGAEAIMAAAGPTQEVAAVVAFEHHARFDQSGYPKVTGRTGLHFFSRLVATIDTYDAMTTRRSYRRAETPNRALRVLVKGSGTLYDPDFVRAFVTMMGIYPPGSLLELDGGEVVMVTQLREGAEYPDAVLVRSREGMLVDVPEPMSLDGRTILDQIGAERIGVDPAALLEAAGISDTE